LSDLLPGAPPRLFAGWALPLLRCLAEVLALRPAVGASYT
jgi:hypothetical protein